MRNAVGDTPTGRERKSAVEGAEKSSGKKLVQARLSFKKITGGSVGGGGGSSSSSSKKGSVSSKDSAVLLICEKGAHHEGRKRKLSFDGTTDEQEEEQSERILRDMRAIKENVLVSANKKKKIDGCGTHDVILLDDDEQDDVAEEGSVAKATKDTALKPTPASPVTPQPVGANRGKSAGTHGSGQGGLQDKSDSSSRKLHIKLPLGVGSSGKRRKLVNELPMKTATSAAADEQMEHSDGGDLPSKRRLKLDEAEKENKGTEKEVVVTIELGSDSESQSELGTSGGIEEPDDTDCEGSSTSSKCETGAESAQVRSSPNVVEVMVKETEKGVEGECNADSHATVAECGANAKIEPRSTVGLDPTPAAVNVKEIEPTDDQRLTTAECSEKAAVVLDSSECTDTTNDKDQPPKPKGGQTDVEIQIGCAQKKHLTPKQRKLLEQRRQVREEKERRLQEERLQKQREKEAKEMIRKREREEREEQRRKEREERDEQKRKEREQKERARLAELEAKNEEKRKRNEAKEEELRKKEEERRRKEQEKEEAEQKAKKAADAFQRFFKPKRTAVVVAPVVESEQGDAVQKGSADLASKATLAFRPFEVKGDMSLAPVWRKTLSTVAREELDRSLNFIGARATAKDGNHNDDEESLPVSQLYLAALKSGKITPEKWRRPTMDTKAVDDDDVLIMEDDLEPAGQAIVEETHAPIERFRAKFYRFWENRRPPYFGTWRKKTTVVSARRPFAQDKAFFDYDVDSDLEWEEEEPGESLDGSDDDKEKESEDDDYEVDNEWFVPHGHLSEEEMQHEDDVDANTREAQQAKLQILQREFAQEMKKKTEKLKPRLIGCIWIDENGNQPKCPQINWNMLCQRAMLCAAPPLLEDADAQERTEPGSPNTNSVEKTDRPKPIALNERMLRDLTRLVHGNRHSKNFLIKEFIAYLESSEETIKSGDVRGPLKSMVREKIDEYAEWQAVDTKINNKSQEYKKKKKKRLCWIVADNVLQRMGLDCIGLHNSWQYTLQPKFANTDRPAVHADEVKIVATPADETNCMVAGANTNEGEEIVKTATAPVNARKAQNDEKCKVAAQPAKKRVPLLMSVARGQKISQPAKNALISEYLKRNSIEKAAVSNVAERAAPAVAPSIAGDIDDVADDDDVVMLD